MEDALLHIGLSSPEIAVYRALQKLGPKSIRTIAASAGINRGTTYEVLKGLTKKGLVSYFPQGKRRFFMATDPDNLITLATEHQQLLTGAIETLKSDIIPALKNSRKTHSAADVQYYEGDHGIEQILRDVLETVGTQRKKEYYVYSAKPMRRYLYKNFPNFTKHRIAQKINVQVLAIGEGGEEAPHATRKWILVSRGIFLTSYIIIYPPKYSIISLTDEDYPYGVVINEPSIAQTQKIIFDALWNTL